MESWRTVTVVQLCDQALQTQDWGVLPILADALQEADYPDEEVLSKLRAPSHTKWEALALIAKIRSEESAEALEWVKAFLVGLGPTDINYFSRFEEYIQQRWDGAERPTYREPTSDDLEYLDFSTLMGLAEKYEESFSSELGFADFGYPDESIQRGQEDWRSQLGERKKEFWDAYGLIVGRDVPESHRGVFLGCSC